MDNDKYYQKYLKYKKKYLELKLNIDGGYPLDDKSLTPIIDANLKNPEFENNFYERRNSTVVSFDRTKKNYTRNLFKPHSLNIINLSDHQAFGLKANDGSIIYSWNVLHSEALCNQIGIASHFRLISTNAIGDQVIIDVSDTKNQVTANIVSQMMYEENIKVFMLQECEYDIYLKLRLYFDNKSDYIINYTPAGVQVNPQNNRVLGVAKYGNCIILRKTLEDQYLEHGTYTGKLNIRFNFKFVGIKFNLIVEGETIYISTHLQNKELEYIVPDIMNVIEQFETQHLDMRINRIILAGDFNATREGRTFSRKIDGVYKEEQEIGVNGIITEMEDRKFTLVENIFEQSRKIDHILIFHRIDDSRADGIRVDGSAEDRGPRAPSAFGEPGGRTDGSYVDGRKYDGSAEDRGHQVPSVFGEPDSGADDAWEFQRRKTNRKKNKGNDNSLESPKKINPHCKDIKNRKDCEEGTDKFCKWGYNGCNKRY